MQGAPVRADDVGQCLSVGPLHGDERLTLDLLDGEDRDDGGMVEGGQRPRFAIEAAASIGIAREAVGQQLQGNVASEPRIAPAIYLAHASGADQGRDFMTAKSAAGSQVHGWGG
jgi:hypothetical protein